jgi:hypothetical protein
MITTNQLGKDLKADQKGDCSLGNTLFHIAGVIGIATKNGYSYSFPNWLQQEYFVNLLPKETRFIPKNYRIPANYAGFDFGFTGFNIPDNVNVIGELGSYKYFEHCDDLIRFYFTMKDICEPYKDCILIHYRDYTGWNGWTSLSDYYVKAIKKLPQKKVIVVTDNIVRASQVLGMKYEYTSNSPIIDFYLLSHADYLVMGNSTFSWWGAYLSKAVTVASLNWFVDPKINEYLLRDTYLKNWILI